VRVLNNKEIDELSKYQHKSSKSTIETYLCNGPTAWMERQFPAFLSPNSLTIIGQAPLQIMVFLVMWNTGLHISTDNLVSKELMLMSAFAIQWFSQVDIMDGCRARRCKAGSPLGRLIDEGGDTLTMANYSILLAYGWSFNNPSSELVFFALNCVFFAMELKYVITGQLVLVVGELSGIEFELAFSLIFLAMGVFGSEGLQSTIGYTFGIPACSNCPLHMICVYKWGSILEVILCLL